MSRTPISFLTSALLHVGLLGVLGSIWLVYDQGGNPSLSLVASFASAQPEEAAEVRLPAETTDVARPENRLQPLPLTVAMTPEGELPPPQASRQGAIDAARVSQSAAKGAPRRRQVRASLLSAAASDFAALRGPVDELPRKLPGNLQPPYPPEARAAGRTGRTVLHLEIDASGRVTAVRLQRSSGTRSLDESALRTVRTWRFSPARRQGQAVASAVSLGVNFGFQD